MPVRAGVHGDSTDVSSGENLITSFKIYALGSEDLNDEVLKHVILVVEPHKRTKNALPHWLSAVVDADQFPFLNASFGGLKPAVASFRALAMT